MYQIIFVVQDYSLNRFLTEWIVGFRLMCCALEELENRSCYLTANTGIGSVSGDQITRKYKCKPDIRFQLVAVLG